MDSRPGTYVIVMHARRDAKLVVGRLGSVQLPRGYYLYVGSAFGSGGLRARVLRHCRREKKVRWHIDYLRSHVDVIEVWYTQDPKRREQCWTELLARSGLSQPIPGFGSSDSRSQSHLFHTQGRPRLGDFRRSVVSELLGHAAIHSWAPG